MSKKRLREEDMESLKGNFRSAVYRYAPSELKKHIVCIAKLGRRKQAPQNALVHVLCSCIGRDTLARIWKAELDKLLYDLLNSREAYDMRRPDGVCHGCYSFYSQTKCPACGKVRFCSGCCDYGKCLACGTWKTDAMHAIDSAGKSEHAQ